VSFFWWRKKEPYRVPSPWSGVLWLGSDLDAGVVVDRETALEVSAVAACLNILALDVAKVPLKIYQRTDAGRRDATWTREGSLVRNGPNAYQSIQDWLECVVLQTLMDGNHYSRKTKVGGYVDQLHPVDDPQAVQVRLVNGRKQFSVVAPTSIPKGTYDQDEIFHVHGPTPDGWCGREFTDTHRQTLSLARAVAWYGARFFSNMGVPGVVLVLPPSAKASDIATAKANFLTNFGGDNTHAVAAYASGTEVKTISVDPEKAQLPSLKRDVAADVAALFNIPIWRLRGETPPSTDARGGYYAETLGPWFRRIELGFNRQVLPAGGAFYARFVTAALVAGDLTARYGAYRTAIEARFLSPNEVREREELNGYAGGQEYINPHTLSSSTQDRQDAGRGGTSAAAGG